MRRPWQIEYYNIHYPGEEAVHAKALLWWDDCYNDISGRVIFLEKMARVYQNACFSLLLPAVFSQFYVWNAPTWDSWNWCGRTVGLRPIFIFPWKADWSHLLISTAKLTATTTGTNVLASLVFEFQILLVFKGKFGVYVMKLAWKNGQNSLH